MAVKIAGTKDGGATCWTDAMNCMSVVVEFTLGIKNLFVHKSYQLFLNILEKIRVGDVVPHVNNLSFEKEMRYEYIK